MLPIRGRRVYHPEVDPRDILVGLGIDQAIDAVEPISGGWDTDLWRVDAGGRSYALRVFRPEQAQTCTREAQVMRALVEHADAPPVPAVHAEGVVDGRPALLLGWCPGRPLLEEIHAAPWRVWSLGVAMGRAHAQIHAVPVSEALAQSLPRWAADDDAPTPDGTLPASILHLDYHPLNVMTAGSGVSGVLDWANVKIGDRRADLARTVTLLRLAPLPPDVPPPLGLALRGLMEAAWRSGYRRHQSADAFVDLDPFYVWAGAMMERDLGPKLGRPGVWLRETDLLRIRRWTIARKARVSSHD